MERPIDVVMIGGGAGGYKTRRSFFGLERHLKITHLTGTWDSGGGTGRLLRDGSIDLPTGDVGQGLLAASLWPVADLEMLTHRDTDGQSMINHMLAAYRAQSDSFAEAVDKAARRLSCQGRVITATIHRTLLTAQPADGGAELVGEHTVDEYRGPLTSSNLYIHPKDGQPNHRLIPEANPEAIEAVADADLIIIGPGSWETSIKPNGLIPQLKEAIKNSPAKIAGIANLANDAHTLGWTAHDYGCKYSQVFDRCLDFLVANTGQVPSEIVELYQKGGERGQQDIVQIGQADGHWPYQLLGYDFVSQQIMPEPSNAGGVTRSLLRHSSPRLQGAILDVLTLSGFNRAW